MKNGWVKVADAVFDSKEVIGLEINFPQYDEKKTANVIVHFRGGGKIIVTGQEAETFMEEFLKENVSDDEVPSEYVAG